MTTEDFAIQTEHLTKRFKQRLAVDDLTLAVRRGEVFGFLGPNGAGKTTTIAMLLALVKPTNGRALVLGHDVQQDPVPALRQVGAMIEAPAFYPYLSGYDNLRVLAQADGLSLDRIPIVLKQVDLDQRGRDRFRTYSQGMKQRLAVAAALLGEPALIILDEPTNGLDPAGTVEMRELIQTLAAEGRTIFLSSHLLHEVQQICQRVAILKEGRLRAEGSVAELLRQRQSIRVEVQDDPHRAHAVLTQVDWITDIVHQNNLLLIEAAAERAPEINSLLVRHDIAVAAINVHEESLETLFLELTEDS